MIERHWERTTAGAGIASAILLVGALATWANPHFNDPLTTITDYYVKHSGLALASIDLWMVGLISLLVLAAGLRRILRVAEDDGDVLSTIAFGGAVAAVCISTAFNAMNGALALYAPQASSSEISLLMALSNAADNFQFLPLGVFVGAASLAMIRTRLFARWIGWLGGIGGALLVIGAMDVTNVGDGIGDLGMFGLMIFLLWSFALSVSLLLRPAVTPHARETPVRAQRLSL